MTLREFPESLHETEMENDLREFTVGEEEETEGSDLTQEEDDSDSEDEKEQGKRGKKNKPKDKPKEQEKVKPIKKKELKKKDKEKKQMKPTKEQSKDALKDKPTKGKWKEKTKLKTRDKDKSRELDKKEKTSKRKSGSSQILGSTGGLEKALVEDVPLTPVEISALFQKYVVSSLCSRATILTLCIIRTLSMCGIVLSVKAQQQHFDSSKVRWGGVSLLRSTALI